MKHGLLRYLALQGVLELPPELLRAPHAGVLVFHKRLGERVEAGEPIAELVNPVSEMVTPICSTRPGVLVASTAHRHLLRGMHVCKVAGATPFRSGDLLGGLGVALDARVGKPLAGRAHPTTSGR